MSVCVLVVCKSCIPASCTCSAHILYFGVHITHTGRCVHDFVLIAWECFHRYIQMVSHAIYYRHDMTYPYNVFITNQIGRNYQTPIIFFVTCIARLFYAQQHNVRKCDSVIAGKMYPLTTHITVLFHSTARFARLWSMKRRDPLSRTHQTNLR